MDFQASVAQVERELVRLGEHGLDTQSWCRAADGLLDRVVGFDGSCWHTIDPATVLITSHLTLNLPSRFPLLAANEYLADDVNKFADLAAGPHPVGLLSQATDGQPQRSQRWQEMLRPNGFDAELRVSFVDGGQCWGSLILVRDRGRADFDPQGVLAVERLAGTLVGGLRRTVVAQQATPEQPAQGPGLVVLDHHGQVESLTPAARHWLQHLGEDPPVLSAVAASARSSGSARARVRTPTGQWLVLHSARLDGDPHGRVSVIIEPPRPADLAPLLVAAYGLSDREQAVIALVFQGRSTRQIARALSISPYTVQEHLTAIFDKVGVRSRGELVGRSSFGTACQRSLTDRPAQQPAQCSCTAPKRWFTLLRVLQPASVNATPKTSGFIAVALLSSLARNRRTVSALAPLRPSRRRPPAPFHRSAGTRAQGDRVPSPRYG